MGQTLTNGIYLPNEGERNCYSGLAANWNAVDTLKGNYSLHAINVDIHVTAAEKETWNGKADASALTAHTGDTTIHVTSADKQTWDDHIADTVKHVTAEDKAKWDAVTSKANDSDVMHLSGNETARGVKTFANGITMKDWLYFTNTSVTKGTIPQSTVSPYRIYFGSGTNYKDSLFNIDTSISSTGVQTLTFRSAENVVNGGDTRLRIIYDPTLTQPRCVKFQSDCLPNSNNTYECGNNSNKWKSFNGINPSALSMPDLSNGIDISSYLSVGASTNDSYTAPANGYIGVIFASSSACGCYVYNYTDGVFMRSNSITDSTYTNVCGCFIPILKNQTLNISTRVTERIVSAKFYPCQGNV